MDGQGWKKWRISNFSPTGCSNMDKAVKASARTNSRYASKPNALVKNHQPVPACNSSTGQAGLVVSLTLAEWEENGPAALQYFQVFLFNTKYAYLAPFNIN